MKYLIAVLFAAVLALGGIASKNHEKYVNEVSKYGKLEQVVEGLKSENEVKAKQLEDTRRDNERLSKEILKNREFENEQNKLVDSLKSEIDELRNKSDENKKYLDGVIPDDIYNRLLDVPKG